MGKFGWHSGYLNAQNVQKGEVTISTDGSGNGTADVTFDEYFKSGPTVSLIATTTDTTGTLCLSGAATAIGFKAKVSGSSVTSGSLTCDWQAID